jgi:hypothetical protein
LELTVDHRYELWLVSPAPERLVGDSGRLGGLCQRLACDKRIYREELLDGEAISVDGILSYHCRKGGDTVRLG